MKLSGGDSIHSLFGRGARQTSVLIFSGLLVLVFFLTMFTRIGMNKIVSGSQFHFLNFETPKVGITKNKTNYNEIKKIPALKKIVKKEIHHKMKNPVNNWKPTYIKAKRHYNFREVGRPFGRVDLTRSSELSGKEFEALILDSVPSSYKDKLKLYVRKTMHTATKYQVDPFWVLSIMWVESHFNRMARSPVDARGLMQIMPNTGKYIASKLKINIKNKSIYNVILNPNMNIEMGVFYLRYLLKYFDGDYVSATIAYNCGPGRMRKILRKRKVIGTENMYLKKVRRVYRFLTREYIATVESKPRPLMVSMKENTK